MMDDPCLNQRVEAYNEGMLNAIRDVREMFEDRFAGLLRDIEQAIAERQAAYGLRIQEPMSDVEAGARALCVAVGMDPVKPILLANTEYAPLWTFRVDEARACIAAALAAPRDPSNADLEPKGNPS